MKVVCNNTGNEFERKYEMESKNDFKKYIGTVFKSKTCGKWICLGVGDRDKHKNKQYIMKNLKTGTVKLYKVGQIKKRYMRDEFYPRIYGVGYIGSIKNPSSNFLYKTWEGMLNRCYNKNHKHYKYYGKKGITVCEDWLNFTNFQSGVKEIEGYDKDKIINHELQLDKDKLQKDLDYKDMEYSKDTCLWLSPRENTMLQFDNNIDLKVNNKNTNNKNDNCNIGLNQNIFCFYNKDIKMYHYNQAEIVNLFGFARTCVSRCLRDDWRTHKGFNFKYVNKFPSDWTVDNCSKKCVEIYNEYLDNKK